MADAITDLLALDDAALAAKFGFDKKIEQAREDLTKLNALTGDAREKAVERVERLLNPTIYADELGWIKDSVCREVKRSAAEEMCDCSPQSLAP